MMTYMIQANRYRIQGEKYRMNVNSYSTHDDDWIHGERVIDTG